VELVPVSLGSDQRRAGAGAVHLGDTCVDNLIDGLLPPRRRPYLHRARLPEHRPALELTVDRPLQQPRVEDPQFRWEMV
jgi:hypothetical protein